MISANDTEQRVHKRFKVPCETAVISFNHSQLPIKDLSSGGLSVEDLNGSLLAEGDYSTSILVNGGTVIRDIPIQLRWANGLISDDSNRESTKSYGIQFKELKVSQRLQIEAIIKWHSEF